MESIIIKCLKCSKNSFLAMLLRNKRLTLVCNNCFYRFGMIVELQLFDYLTGEQTPAMNMKSFIEDWGKFEQQLEEGEL